MSHDEHDPAYDRKWHELDDTLADGPSPSEVPEEAREWLAEQRLMHGLLRAVHTADASAREARVESVLGRIDAGGVIARRRHWLAVAAAALIFAMLTMWIAAPTALPTAEAAMARVVNQMSLEIDRKFHIKLSSAGRKQPDKVITEFDLTLRPGMRFLIEGRLRLPALNGVKSRAGCDGQTLWFESENGRRRSARLSDGISDRRAVFDDLGDILDGGYLDLHSLIKRIPDAFDLQVSERLEGADGRPQLHIKARRRGGRFKPDRVRGLARWRSLELTVDELTGLVTHLDGPVRMTSGIIRHILIDYLGQPASGAMDYSRPW